MEYGGGVDDGGGGGGGGEEGEEEGTVCGGQLRKTVTSNDI